MAKLRVGIDGRAFSSPAAGVRRYVTGLVPALRALNAPLEIVVLGGRAADAPRDCERVAEPFHPPTNLGWALVGLPHAADWAGVQIIHAPAYTAPLGARAPVVVTIHDISYERHPEWYPYRRDWLRRAFYRRSARSAAHVLTDSQFSADEIHAAYRIAPECITVAPLGVSARFDGEAGGVRAPVPAGIASPFLLHVGDLHTRRNLGVVVDAVAALRGRSGDVGRLTLVLAGLDRGLLPELRARAAAAGAPDVVVALGVVSDARLETLYQEAAALVYPSLYEGFGLPVLEAMSRGTPVIASRAASIPEVLGDAGDLIDPLDVMSWAHAIVRMLADGGHRERLRAAGLARAAEFTWERTARATYEVYARVARP